MSVIVPWFQRLKIRDKHRHLSQKKNFLCVILRYIGKKILRQVPVEIKHAGPNLLNTFSLTISVLIALLATRTTKHKCQ